MLVFIVGFMGAGKTTLGRRLAEMLDCEYLDLDQAFEEKFHFSIYNFFDRFGEDKFRDIEHQLLVETISSNDNVVISTGGGTPCFYDNMQLMNDNGKTIYINMHVNSLKHRLLKSRRKRPALNGLNENELENYIDRLLPVREKIYLEADHIVQGENIEIDELVTLVKQDKTRSV